jgi:hypothetical protein
VKSEKQSDDYQWAKFLEHWGLSINVVLVFLVTRIFLFFVNLKGIPWISFLTGSFASMLFGAALIVRAKWPVYRNGRFFTFGIHSVPQELTKHYQWEWRSFLAGVIVAVCLLFSR